MKNGNRKIYLLAGTMLLLLAAALFFWHAPSPKKGALRSDILILSPSGFSPETVARCSQYGTAEGQYFGDAVLVCGEERRPVTIASVNTLVEIPEAEEGRPAERSEEALAAASFLKENGLSLYETILLEEDGISTPLKITGITEETGNGIAADLYLPKGHFRKNGYDRICLSVPKDSEGESREEYKDKLDGITEEIRSWESEAKEDRSRKQKEDLREQMEEVSLLKDFLHTQYGEKLKAAEKELEEGKEALAKGNEALEDGRDELARAEALLSDAKYELQEKKALLAEADGQLAANREKLAEGYRELEEGKKKLDEYRGMLRDGENAYSNGKEELNSLYHELSEMLHKLRLLIGELENIDTTFGKIRTDVDDLREEASELLSLLTELRDEVMKEGEADENVIRELAEKIIKRAEQCIGTASQVLKDAEEILVLDMEKALMIPGEDEIKKLDLNAFYDLLKQVKKYQELSQRTVTLIKDFKGTTEDLEKLRDLILQFTDMEVTFGQTVKDVGLYIEKIPEALKKLKELETELSGYGSSIPSGSDIQSALSEARRLIAEMEGEYNNGLSLYESSEKLLSDKEEEYRQGLQLYREYEGLYREKAEELEAGKKTLLEKEEEYRSGTEKYEDGRKEYLKQKQRYDRKKGSLDAETALLQKEMDGITAAAWTFVYPLLDAGVSSAALQEESVDRRRLWRDAVEKVRLQDNETVTVTASSDGPPAQTTLYEEMGSSLHGKGDPVLRETDFTEILAALPEDFITKAEQAGISLTDDAVDHSEVYLRNTPEGDRILVRLTEPGLWIDIPAPAGSDALISSGVMDHIRICEGLIDQGKLRFDEKTGNFRGEDLDTTAFLSGEEITITDITVEMDRGRIRRITENAVNAAGQAETKEIRFENTGETYFRFPKNVLDETLLSEDD